MWERRCSRLFIRISRLDIRLSSLSNRAFIAEPCCRIRPDRVIVARMMLMSSGVMVIVQYSNFPGFLAWDVKRAVLSDPGKIRAPVSPSRQRPARLPPLGQNAIPGRSEKATGKVVPVRLPGVPATGPGRLERQPSTRRYRPQSGGVDRSFVVSIFQ